MIKHLKLKKENKLYHFFYTLWIISKRSFIRFYENQGFLIANGLAFKTIIAFVPAILIVAGFLKIFPDTIFLRQNLIQFINDILPNQTNLNLVSWIDDIISKSGSISIISFFIFIYLSLDLLITLDNQVERIWGLKLKSPLVQKVLKYWALLSATPFLLGGYFYFFGLFRSVQFINPLTSLINFQEIIYIIITFLLLTVFFFFAYFLIPNYKVNILKAVIVSTVISAVWMILRIFFAYYTVVFFERWSFFYGSFVVILIFILWTSINWIVLLLGVEFLCVWQNKLYMAKIKFKELFLFDVGFILLILHELNEDFTAKGTGISTKELAKKFRYNQNNFKVLIKLLESEELIISDKKSPPKFYLRKNLASIKLSDIEEIVWKRLAKLDYNTSPKLQSICEKLGKYYYHHKDKSIVFINDIISK